MCVSVCVCVFVFVCTRQSAHPHAGLRSTAFVGLAPPSLPKTINSVTATPRLRHRPKQSLERGLREVTSSSLTSLMTGQFQNTLPLQLGL